MGPSNNFWKWSWKKIFVWEIKCTAAQHARSPKNVKKPQTTNLMWLSLIWAILVLFVCWNLFYTLANLRIKCVTETKNVSLLFYKNLKSSFSTWLTGFFTFFVTLAHGVPPPFLISWKHKAWILFCSVQRNIMEGVDKYVILFYIPYTS